MNYKMGRFLEERDSYRGSLAAFSEWLSAIKSKYEATTAKQSDIEDEIDTVKVFIDI